MSTLKDVREGISTLIHECMEEGVKPTVRADSTFDVVQKLSLLLDTLDVTLDTLRREGNLSAGLDSPTQGRSPKVTTVIDHALAATDLGALPLAEAVLSPSATPETAALRAAARHKRQSVSFLPEGSPIVSPKMNSGSPKADGTAEGQVDGWLSRTYSGYGSFRRQSRASMVQEELCGVKDDALGFSEFGMPTLDLAGAADPRNTFSRPVGRHTAVFSEDTSHLFDEISGLFDFEIPELDSIDDTDFDVFSLLVEPGSPVRGDRQGADRRVEDNRRIFIIVAANVFLRYSFVTTYQLAIDKFSKFLKELSLLFSTTTPFHNALHAADMLQAVHVYFCQQNVKENFQDVELFATLFSAMCCQVGHLGVSNEFLARIDHPLVRLFTDTCPQENFAAAISFKLLAEPELNFLDTPQWNSDPLHHLTFKEIASDAILKAAGRYHLSHIQAMGEVIENGVVKDIDVPVVLSAVVRVADCRYACLPESNYIRWVGHFVEENYQQGDEEVKRGFEEISALCDRHQDAAQGHKVKAQIAFLTHVVQPLLQAMGPVLPTAWLNQLQRNLESHGGGPSPRNSFTMGSPGPLSPGIRSDDEITEAQPPQGEWTDNSTSTLASLLSSVAPGVVFPNGASAGNGTVSSSVTGGLAGPAYHNFALLRMLQSHWAANPVPSTKTDEELMGHIVQLAIKLNPAYIGTKVLSILQQLTGDVTSITFSGAIRLGHCIMQEVLPSNFSLMTESSPEASHPYLILVLQTHDQMIRSTNVAANAAVNTPSRSEGRREADQRRGDSVMANSGVYSNISGGSTNIASQGRWLGPVENTVYRPQ